MAKSKAKQPRNSHRREKKADDKRGTNPNSLANLQPFKSTEENGGVIDPRINAGGRAKLSEAYGDVLASIFPDGGISPEFKYFADAFAPGRRLTHAEKIALMVAIAAGRGDIAAAREIRAATEGEKITLATWQTEIVDALKAGKLTPQQVIDELGIEDARAILVAAGAFVFQGTSETDSGRGVDAVETAPAESPAADRL